MAFAKIQGALSKEIKEVKNNLPELLELNWDKELVINLLEPKEFHEHYQTLAPTKEKQKQYLAQINTRLCDHCLISCDFQYCNECDLIYNPPPRMIYTIPEEEEPISSCVSESKLIFNPDSNSNNKDNKNTNSSSMQYGNKNINNSDSDLNPKIYIALPDLSKEQELKWYSDNNKDIMPERAYDTDTGFNLRYPGKDAIKLEPHSCTCIDLKIALEILATTMVQLASRNSLVKKRINIRGKIIDTGYVENIIAMLQNDSEKAYIIEPNEKIAQTIFLPLVKITQLASMGNRKKLGITMKGIQRFKFMNKINIPVNMAKEEIIGQGEIISTGQAISISPYDQYMLAIKRKVKDQTQIFEVETSLYKTRKVGFINLHIPAKNHNHIKISIYNNTENIVEILKGTTLRYLTTEIENQPPSTISDFPQLCEYVDITSQTIYGQNKCYLLQLEQLEQINIGNLDLLQQIQLKMLLNNFNDIFASENEFGRTDIIQHQIKTGDAMPIKQRAYRVPPASHEIIRQEINRMLDNGINEPIVITSDTRLKKE
ncbi:hypothetical protein G9A89_019722 [Geosiphon pyriformis]|nr:hypothetical protein G9A89_019722 [Geosiphon pyriformis]